MLSRLDLFRNYTTFERFLIVVERCHLRLGNPSREAAKERSPRRKPWVEIRKRSSPSGAEEEVA